MHPKLKGNVKIFSGLVAAQAAPAFATAVTWAVNPWLETSFHLSRAGTGLAVALFFGGTAVTGIPLGLFVDRRGPYLTTLIFTGLLFSAGILGAGLAPTYPLMLAALTVAGMGYGAAAPATNVMVLRLVDPARRAQAMGVKQMGSAAGVALAGTALPFLAIAWGWHTVFFVAALLSLATILAALAALTRNGPAPQNGALLKAHVKRGASVEKTAPFKAALRAAGRSGLASVGFIIARWGVAAYLMIFAMHGLHRSLAAAATVLAASQMGGIAGSFGWTWLNDHTKSRDPYRMWQRAGIAGAGLLVLLTLLGPSVPEVLLVTLSFFIGCTTSGWIGLYMNTLADGFESTAGLRSGIGQTLTDAGTLAGVPAMGFVMDASATPRWGFLFLALLLVASALLLRRSPYPGKTARGRPFSQRPPSETPSPRSR